MAATLDKNNHFCSPPPASSSEITPPPSSQIHAPVRRRSRSRSGSEEVVPASPPSTSLEKTLCAAYGATENLPTTEDIDNADEGQLRVMAKELLGVAQEARMSALHFKLQHSLLSFASNEAIKRAEVEQQLARREVEILQSSEYRNRNGVSRYRTPQLSPSPQLDSSLKRIEELERQNARLEERLMNAKKLIREKMEEGNLKQESLLEENQRLKKRIRENREHFALIIDRGSLSPHNRGEYEAQQRKAHSRNPEHTHTHTGRSDNHDAFATLLAADRVLHGDSSAVSPTRSRQSRDYSSYARGSHTVPAFPTTPQRSRDVRESQYATPGSRPRDDIGRSSHDREQERAMRDREDRDSTISVESDVEEAVTDDELPASQASSLATSMLRRFPGSSQEEKAPPQSRPIGKSNNLVQAKIFGQVKKPGVAQPGSFPVKRRRSIEDDGPTIKRAKESHVGLGIDAWRASPA